MNNVSASNPQKISALKRKELRIKLTKYMEKVSVNIQKTDIKEEEKTNLLNEF